MAYTVIMQDWTTVQGTGTGSSTGATQAESEWLNVAGVQDIVFYIFFSQFSGTALAFNFESAPLKEETLFLPLLSTSITAPTPSSTVPNVQIARYSSGTTTNPPLSAWLRWRFQSASAAWTSTFRVVAALNPNTVGLHSSGMATISTPMAMPGRNAISSLIAKG